MSSRMRCPHCNSVLDHVSVTGDYSCYAYGTCSGFRDIGEDGYDEWEDDEQSGSDDWEYSNEQYSCPECDTTIDWSYIEDAGESDMDIYSTNGDDEEEGTLVVRDGGAMHIRYESPLTRRDKECSVCHYPLLFIAEEQEKECPICGTNNKQ